MLILDSTILKDTDLKYIKLPTPVQVKENLRAS